MTLDPVHFDGIARLARRIDQGASEQDHRELAETVWAEFLDPLTDGDRVVLEPIEDVSRHLVDIERIALSERPFPTQHGLDAGTINPTSFRNGLVIDIAQAAMASSPSTLDLHRSRTVVATVHSNDATASVNDRWDTFDAGYSRSRAVKVPSLPRFAEGVVHALALYMAEGEHALSHADAVDDLLVLDGPLYPRGLLRWADQHSDLAELLVTERQPRSVLEKYVRLVESFVERSVPLVGFVKNPATRVLSRTVAEHGMETPWTDDTAFFTRVLERGESGTGPDGRQFDRETDALTYTGWFRSRGGVDGPMSIDGDALGVERTLDPACYEVTFFVVYDPRTDLCYRIEAPYAFTRNAEVREALTRHLLAEVATSRGPPPVVEKADELARISAPEKASLRETFEERFATTAERDYDDRRWGDDGRPFDSAGLR